MAGNRPMITLQCGNYANYIGTHFWNLQVAAVTIQLVVKYGYLRRLGLSMVAMMETVGNCSKWTMMCCSGRV